MDVRDEFIEEFGQKVFDDIFNNIYGDQSDDYITIFTRHYSDRINSSGHGVFQWHGKEVSFTYQDGDWNGSEIIDYSYGELVIPQPTKTITIFVLDEQRIINEGHNIEFMRNKFEALREEIGKKEREYSYDRYHQPGQYIEQYYRKWMYDNYLTTDTKTIEVDY